MGVGRAAALLTAETCQQGRARRPSSSQHPSGEFPKLLQPPAWPRHPAGWGQKEGGLSGGAQGQRSEGVLAVGRWGLTPEQGSYPRIAGFGLALLTQSPQLTV